MVLLYNNIDIYHGDHMVLHNVHLTVNEGDMVYITGSVGCGKTSLLKTMYGALPCEGEVADIMGYDLIHLKTKQQPALRRMIGVIFQDFQLLQDHSIRSNLDFVLRATGWERNKERDKRIMEVLELVRLTDKVDSMVYELSGGEQQRICIARAILNNPKVILADEPTGNLDTENGEMILALLDEIRRQNKTAVVMSTHNLQWPVYFPGTVYKCENCEIHKVE